MIFKKITVGPSDTNSYIIGSDITKEIAIIDPGFEPEKIIGEINKIGATPVAILLTHGHFDHSMYLNEILKNFPKIELIYNKKEYNSLQTNLKEQDIEILVDLMDNKKDETLEQNNKEQAIDFLIEKGLYTNIKADRWLNEGDIIKIGELNFKTLETPGHSPGSLSFYSKDVNEIRGHLIDGVIFTGDLLFKRDVGQFNIPGGDEQLLYLSVKNKLMNNPDITDRFKVCAGHWGYTTIGEERILNPFRKYFT
ncbi:MAG: MBL fold metallo-hydrolase [Candidatus Lokiarchaeota archaeon]|nr:MBL fold metallo-hydrolase [Candidatus Lokiarchaeota archaeon]